MSLGVRVLCRPMTAPGFRLASLSPRVLETDASGLAEARAETRAPDAGVVLVDQGIFDRLSTEDHRRLGRRPLPIVVPFPAPQWQTATQAAEAYVLELLRQVIGYRVRLK